MICAYDKNYLAAAQKNLARMLDYLVNGLHHPLETAWQWFLASELSARFEQGDCTVLVGLSGVELARTVLEQAREPAPVQQPSYAYDRSPEYWTGWALAYYQWFTGLRLRRSSKRCRSRRCGFCILPTTRWMCDSLLTR